jgi:hypothetical protein
MIAVSQGKPAGVCQGPRHCWPWELEAFAVDNHPPHPLLSSGDVRHVVAHVERYSIWTLRAAFGNVNQSMLLTNVVHL